MRTVVFSDDARRSILNYKYSGGDSSPVYQHVLSPFAQWCVDMFIPSWMAPNVITALGLACSFAALSLTIIFNPSLGPNAPRWLHLFTACSIFLYQTLDNMDGKQARKTGTSSALGMLFDHGCDAMNAGISVITMSSVMATGWGGKLFFGYLSSFILFYFQTWEEYYVGTMVLPPFNGPSEGLIMAYGLGVITFFFGPEVLHEPLFDVPSVLLLPDIDLLSSMDFPTIKNPHLTPFNIMFIIVCLCAFFTSMGQVIRVIIHLSKTKPEVIPRALLNLSPFVVFLPCVFYYNLHSKIAMSQYPFVTALFHAATFAELVVHIMVGHITHTRIMSIERYSVWLFVVLLIVSYYEQGQGPYEALLLFALTIFSTASFASYFYSVCTEFAETLNINVFAIGPRNSNRIVKKSA